MATINLEKFICDTIQMGRKWYKGDLDNECLDRMVDLFKVVLENQGLICQGGQLVEINASATEKSEEELTEFEQYVENLLNLSDGEGHAATTVENTKRVAKELLSLTRKQIAEEINVGIMVNGFYDCKTANSLMLFEIYQKGILDTLEKIKGK